MKQNYFVASYGDFVKFNEKPNEDFYFVPKKNPVFAIADGITRFSYENINKTLLNGARKAAEIFCLESAKYLEKNLDFKTANSKSIKNAIKKAFDFVNERIKRLNIRYGIPKKMDYIKYDWFGAVGVAGIILKNKLYYGYLGDCGVVIFDKKNKKKFQTKNMVASALEKFKNWKEFSPEKRALIIHKNLRNNPNKKGYGSFTGESRIENYYEIGIKKLKEDDLVVFYSDGLLELLKDKNFVEILRKKDRRKLDKFVLRKAKEDEQKYGRDRTFIATIFTKN
jgi:serine/threonine protein phosphatase PrpC